MNRHILFETFKQIAFPTLNLSPELSMQATDLDAVFISELDLFVVGGLRQVN